MKIKNSTRVFSSGRFKKLQIQIASTAISSRLVKIQGRWQLSIWWPGDGSDEFLGRRDGVLSVELLRKIRSQREVSGEPLDTVLEVGVWKGAWTSVILMNLPDVKLYGVDPYPAEGLDEVRELMKVRLSALHVSDRFTLFDSLSELPTNAVFSMIHLDGEHTEGAVEAELCYANQHLADDGIVVVDDYRHFWFPGVASAMYGFLANNDLKLFAASEFKAYLARPTKCNMYYEYLSNTFARSSEVPVWTDWQQWSGLSVYAQPPEVGGQRVLMCGVDALRTPHRLSVNDLIPPIVLRIASNVRMSTRTWLARRR